VIGQASRPPQAFYDSKENRIVICLNSIERLDTTAARKRVKDNVTHELIHAFDVICALPRNLFVEADTFLYI